MNQTDNYAEKSIHKILESLALTYYAILCRANELTKDAAVLIIHNQFRTVAEQKKTEFSRADRRMTILLCNFRSVELHYGHLPSSLCAFIFTNALKSIVRSAIPSASRDVRNTD